MSTGRGNPGGLVKGFSVRDWMVVGGGAVVFVFSFFDYVGFSIPELGITASVNAWHSYAVLGLLLVLATSVTWALKATGKAAPPPLPAEFELVATGAAGLGTLLILLRGVTYSTNVSGVSAGLRFGGVVVILAGAVVTAGAAWAHYARGGFGSSTRG